jgi:hypothetical protein
MADKKKFSNTKSIVKVETGIVTLISYHHYLKIVGNNKLSGMSLEADNRRKSPVTLAVTNDPEVLLCTDLLTFTILA